MNGVLSIFVHNRLTMLWVDHKNYFGPDRRHKHALRLRERRQYDYAGRAPSLSQAIRQLRLHVIDARGPQGAGAFMDRANAVAMLADMSEETEAAHMLTRLAAGMGRARDTDMRPQIYAALDRIQGAMLTYN
ncbi:hypothetical protein [Terricaulis sp.]|uniref:hypothetical protein n=1 Tax=Terricaulis sp. TaxID=2768686 RepID=UPI00378345E7